MIDVPRNHFYKKVNITDTVQIKNEFKDLPNGASQDIIFSNISNLNQILLTGNIPALPAYGDSTVVGGYLQVYGSDINTKNTRDGANFNIYAVAPDVIVDEGGLSLAHESGSTAKPEVGHQVAVYTSVPTGSIYKFENFESASFTPESIQRMGGGNVLTMSEPYVRLDEFANFYNAREGTDYSWTSVFMKKFERYTKKVGFNEDVVMTGPGSRAPPAGTADTQLKISYINGNKARVKMNNTGGAWGKSFTLKFDTSEIQHILRYRIIESTPGSILTPAPATKHTTIFDSIVSAKQGPGPFDSSDTNPMTMSNIELSTENTIDGGQALRFYHNWGYSVANPEIQGTLGNPKNLNPQVSYASIYDLPLPPSPFDIGRSTFSSEDTTPVYGNHRAVCPEIQMAMNITKLAPNVQVNISGCAALLNPYSYYNQDTTSLVKAHCSKEAYTFLRSVVITFSNYKPKASHTTVDKFIDYGLQRFYSDETTDHIVGGIVFYAEDIGGNQFQSIAKDNEYYAMPIPVTKVAQCVSGSSEISQTILAEGGIAKLRGNTTVTTPATAQLADVDILTWGANNPGTSSITRTGATPQFVNIPANSWFNMRMFMNADFYNNTGSALLNPYSGSLKYLTASERGSCMRVYFDVEGENETSDNPTDNIPCLDIPFPAAGDSSTASYKWTATPANFPQHMTIWVQNYPWVSDQANAAVAENLFHYADSDIVPDGASKEVEVFIDNIKVLNFGPQTTNNTADAYAGRVSLKSGDYYSPLGTMINNNTYRSSWVNSKTTLTPRSGSNNIGDNPTYQGASYYNYNHGQAILIGFDNKSDLPISSNYSTDAMGYLLFNDFRTTDYSTLKGSMSTSGYSTNTFFKNRLFNDPSDASKSGGIFSQEQVLTQNSSTTKKIHLGNQLDATTDMDTASTGAQYYDYVSGSLYKIDPTTTGGTDDAFSLGSQTNNFMSTNAFREKGFVRVSVSGATYTNWIKREHLLASTKVTALGVTTVESTDTDGGTATATTMNNNAIRVQDPSLFNFTNENETYVIYLMNAAPGNWGGSSATMRTGLKLDKFLPDDTGLITFSEQVVFADDGATRLVSQANLPRLWVGPEKYWLTMLLDTPPTLTPRSYENVCTINETPSTGSLAAQLGATFNEWEYNYTTAGQASLTSALYNKIWTPDLGVGSSMVISDQDFGYGVYDEETEDGGQVSQSQLLYTRFNYFDINEYLKQKIPDASEATPIPLMMSMIGDSTVQSFTIKGASSSEGSVDDTAYRPYVYVKYQDMPPIISNLSVSPTYDVLSGETNLYDLTTENLNSLTFTWEEENADDIWYRMLMVDNKPIKNKYANAIMWLPLNEKPLTPVTVPTISVYNPTNENTSSYAASGTCTVGDRVRSVLEGQAGYAVKVNTSGTTSSGKVIVEDATNAALEDLTEFTLVVHWTPALDDLNNERFIITQAGNYNVAGNFIMSKNTNNQIVITMGTGIALTGTSSLECDGSVPTNIIMTFNTGSAMAAKAKLYINGALEDTSTGTTGVTGDNDFTIGARHDSSKQGTRGTFEEIILYNKEYEVIDEGDEYIFNTSNILDGNVTGGVMDSLYTHNARLFAMDYHNFRGYSSKEVAMSSTLSWRATTL